MLLRDILDLITNIAKQKDISTPFLCGGAARGKLIGNTSNNSLSDLDITTGDKTVHNLAQEVAIVLDKKFTITSRKMDDGHTTIFFGNLKIDFSSNFIVPNIESLLKEKNILKPTDLQKEMFSRDFTCNALLLDFNLKTISDPTENGIKDIEKKLIKTCLDPETTFSNNKNRSIRAIYLAAKLGFKIDEETIEWLKTNKEIFKELDQSYLLKTLNKATDYNVNSTAYWINKLNLWDVLPMTEKLYPLFNNKSLIKEAQFFRNYDYGTGKGDKSGPGTGLWSNLDRYKSISDFRKKRRKQRKENLKKIIKTRPK